MKNKFNNYALVIGGDHQNPLGIIEALAQKDIYSYAIIYTPHKKSFVLKSKYIIKGWICHSEKDVISCMFKNFSNMQNKTVTFTCSDDVAYIINCNFNTLKKHFILQGIPNQGELKKYLNKEYMDRVAQKNGLRVPKSWVIKNGIIPKGISFPCITKPITSIKNGKNGFSLCENFSELETFINKNPNKEYQIQQYIDSELEFQYLGCSFNQGEDIFIPGKTQINRTINFNNLTFLKYQKTIVCEDTDNINTIRSFFKDVKYSGLFSVEFLHGKDGKDYFLEVNFRNDGNGAAVTSAGTNLPYIWYLYATKRDYNTEILNSDVKETYFLPEESYFISMLNGDIPYARWKKNVKLATSYLTYFKGDTKPFWAFIWTNKSILIRCLIKRVLRTLHLTKIIKCRKSLTK